MDLRPPKTEPSKLGSTHKKTSGRRKWLRRFLLLVSLVCIGVGVYIAVLLLSPQVDLPVKSDVDLNTADDTSDARDRIQIEKINLEVPFYTGGAEALEKGAWHRFPDRGDPEKGGNFILSAHRFRIAGDPILTREQSPFYNL
ncbi:MAG: hypothetical protein QG658_74, partial [Patescibacteria group bacterium]|nr:hypothetical protein [Patescibacteria group bacterium]